MNIGNLNVEKREIARIARKYGVKNLYLFGSALRDDFSDTSDIDLMVEFYHSEKVSLFDVIDLKHELEDLMGHNVDLVEKDKRTRFAVERQLLVKGETAGRISEPSKNDLPCIPWRRIIGLRNIIAHEYGEILTDRIWNVCINNISELFIELCKISIDP